MFQVQLAQRAEAFLFLFLFVEWVMFFKSKNVSSFKVLQSSEAIEFKEGESLLDALDRKFTMNQSCGGMGSCGTCRVRLSDDSVYPKRNEVEEEMAEVRSFDKLERLSCQTLACEDLIVDLSPQNIRKED